MSVNEGFIWYLRQSSIRPSIYFSSIVKSRSNLFLEPTGTKQLVISIDALMQGYVKSLFLVEHYILWITPVI